MKFPKLQELAESKTYIVGNRLPPRGKPEEKARAFDAPGTNRSELKKMHSTEFKVTRAELDFVDWTSPDADELMRFSNQLFVYLKSDNKDPSYKGVRVLFQVEDDEPAVYNTDEAEVDAVGSSSVGKFEASKLERKIIQTALKAIRDGNLPGVHEKVTISR